MLILPLVHLITDSFFCIFQNEPASPVKLEKVKVEGSVTEDNKFENWRKLCKRIADHPSYNDKTNIGKSVTSVTVGLVRWRVMCIFCVSVRATTGLI